MPRPGYEPEEDLSFDDDDSPQSLLANFDPESQRELARYLAEGSLTAAHVLQIYRLLTMSPEERDPDFVIGIAEQAAKMGSEEFKDWVNERAALWRDQ
jgi:hypothetical protein